MNPSTLTALKGAGCLGAVGAIAAGGALFKDKISEAFSGKETSVERMLIDYLEDEAKDIVFEVKTGKAAASETNINADQNVNVEALKFEEGKNKILVKVKATIDSSETSLKGGGEGKITKQNLLELNKSGDNDVPWIWECNVLLENKNTSTQSKEINGMERNLIYKDANDGVFVLLAKNSLDSETNSEQKKKIKGSKRRFISACMGTSEASQQKISSNSLKFFGTFELRAADGSIENETETEKLYFNDKVAMKKWFGEPIDEGSQ